MPFDMKADKDNDQVWKTANWKRVACSDLKIELPGRIQVAGVSQMFLHRRIFPGRHKHQTSLTSDQENVDLTAT